MCTASTLLTKGFYFGRTLDYDFSYGDSIVFAPRNYSFEGAGGKLSGSHYAILGMAHPAYNYPLFYDAMNEYGLAMAGLNFVGNAVYGSPETGKINIPTYEFIAFILGKCKSLSEARQQLAAIKLTDEQFHEFPAAQLHWIIADKTGAVTVESTREGMKVYENPVGILANNPPFDMQMMNLSNYMNLSPKDPENKFGIPLNRYSRGMGALGLPGDLSSESRFVRAAFTKMNSVCAGGEAESVSQFFHILGTVSQTRGCCDVDGKYEITLYTDCYSCDERVMYYTTYDNQCISAVDMKKENHDGTELHCFEPICEQQIFRQN